MARYLASLALVWALCVPQHAHARSVLIRCTVERLVRNARITRGLARCARSPRVIGRMSLALDMDERAVVTGAEVRDTDSLLTPEQRACVETLLRERLVGRTSTDTVRTAPTFVVEVTFTERRVLLGFTRPYPCRGDLVF